MTVWSAEKITDAKRHILRLPRARSTPNSRHWMLQRDAGVAATSSLSNSTPTGRNSNSSLPFQQGGAATTWRHGSNLTGQELQNPAHPRQSKPEPMPTHHVEMRQTRQAHTAQLVMEADGDVRNPGSFVTGCTSSTPRRIEKVGIRSDMADPLPLRCGSSARRHFADNTGSPEDCTFSASAPVAGIKKVYREISSGPKQLTRKLSVPSEEAMRQLGELGKVLLGIEQRVEQLSRLADEQAQLTPESMARLKTSLAQLEAEAHKLETNGVDGIYTSELKSGQVFAKESKKSQLRRLEKLFGVIEDIFHKLNAAKLSGSM